MENNMEMYWEKHDKEYCVDECSGYKINCYDYLPTGIKNKENVCFWKVKEINNNLENKNKIKIDDKMKDIIDIQYHAREQNIQDDYIKMYTSLWEQDKEMNGSLSNYIFTENYQKLRDVRHDKCIDQCWTILESIIQNK